MRQLTCLGAVTLLMACADVPMTEPELIPTDAVPSHAAETIEKTRTYEEFTGLVPGAGNCAGEPVEATFRTEIRAFWRVDGAGKLHANITLVDRGSSATGLVSGTRYRVINSQTESLQADSPDLDGRVTYTAIFSRRFISKGSAANFQVHNTYHITIDADGTVVTEHVSDRRTCR